MTQELVRCKMVSVPRWRYDDLGLAWYCGFYLPVPLAEGEDEAGSIMLTATYIAATNKMKEAYDAGTTAGTVRHGQYPL